MKKMLSALTWSLILGLVTVTMAEEKTETEAPRKYAHDFEGQDLTKQKFDKKNLDNSNFADADLTEASFEGASMKNCNFRGAKLSYTNFTRADMTGSDFRETTFHFPSLYMAVLNKTNFSDVDLHSTSLNELKVREANFRNTTGFNEVYGADFYQTDLRGADLSQASESGPPGNFRKARSDQFTRWFDGFDVKARGLTVVDTKEEPADEDAPEHADKKKDSEKPAPKPSKPNKNDPEAEFQKLDKNEDGVLSGKELQGFESRDANEDEEVTLAEFIAGAAE